MPETKDEVKYNRIEFYETIDGKRPVEEFLDGISDIKLKVKTLKNLQLLDSEGQKLRAPYSEYVEDGILELRTKQSSNIDRIFYFFVVGDKIIMTNGYIKKSQKLDNDELAKAKKYRDDYMNRYFPKNTKEKK